MPNWINFIAEYEDGTTERFRIDRSTLSQGDHVARTIARERQEAGQLKPGKILKVYRERRYGWIKTSLGWLNVRKVPVGFNFNRRDEDASKDN
jgi:hypothetical protein